MPDTHLDQQQAQELQALADSGVFDAVWYAANNADVAHGGDDPASHFVSRGWREGRRPCFYLDPAWYLAAHPDVQAAGFDAVLHFVMHGDQEGRRAGAHFDTAWYRARQGLDPSQPALAHYLRHRLHGASPIPEFDAEFSLSTYRDVARAGVDPFEHYIPLGWQEGREPSSDFDSRYYVKRHMGGAANQAPLLHFLAHRDEPGVAARMPQETPTIPREFRRNMDELARKVLVDEEELARGHRHEAYCGDSAPSSMRTMSSAAAPARDNKRRRPSSWS